MEKKIWAFGLSFSGLATYQMDSMAAVAAGARLRIMLNSYPCLFSLACLLVTVSLFSAYSTSLADLCNLLRWSGPTIIGG